MMVVIECFAASKPAQLSWCSGPSIALAGVSPISASPGSLATAAATSWAAAAATAASATAATADFSHVPAQPRA
jgi:hypothetical protein